MQGVDTTKEILAIAWFLCSITIHSLLSQRVIHLGKSPTFHSRSKHIDVRYHWIHDVLNDKFFELEKVHTNDNGTDMISKALPRGEFEVCCDIVGLAVIST